MSTPGNRLVEMRELKHLTQARLADAIQMSPSQLNKYEKDKNNFTFGFRIKLNSIFSDAELDYIQYGENVPEKKSISQGGINNNQVVGNNNSNIGSGGSSLSGIDKEIAELLKFAPGPFKENVLSKLKKFKEDSEI